MSGPITLPFTHINNGGQNGRVNLNAPPSAGGGSIDNFPAYAHQKKVETSFEDDMLRGNWESNTLTKAFFSPANIKTIQNSIRNEVFNQSKPKGYVIDEQSVDELKIIMRGIYYQYARNLPTNIAEQVADLNKKVIDWSVPHILSAVDHYYFYLNDISHMPVPMEKPQNVSSAGVKSLPLNPYM